MLLLWRAFIHFHLRPKGAWRRLDVAFAATSTTTPAATASAEEDFCANRYGSTRCAQWMCAGPTLDQVSPWNTQDGSSWGSGLSRLLFAATHLGREGHTFTLPIPQFHLFHSILSRFQFTSIHQGYVAFENFIRDETCCR